MDLDRDRVDLGPCGGLLHRPEAPDRVVLLPGARYPTQAPLLWFAREIALAQGAGVLEVLDEMPSEGDPSPGRATVQTAPLTSLPRRAAW